MRGFENFICHLVKLVQMSVLIRKLYLMEIRHKTKFLKYHKCFLIF